MQLERSAEPEARTALPLPPKGGSPRAVTFMGEPLTINELRLTLSQATEDWLAALHKTWILRIAESRAYGLGADVTDLHARFLVAEDVENKAARQLQSVRGKLEQAAKWWESR